jgi:hypothetical protein
MRCSNAALHSDRTISTSKLEFRVRDRNRQLMGENQMNAINKSQQSFLLPHSHMVSERKPMPGGLDEPRNAMNRKMDGTQRRAFSRKEKSLAPCRYPSGQSSRKPTRYTDWAIPAHGGTITVQNTSGPSFNFFSPFSRVFLPKKFPSNIDFY